MVQGKTKIGELLPKKKFGPKVHWKGIHGVMDADCVYEYAKTGLNMEQIGDLYGCSKANISQTIGKDEELKLAWKQGHSELLLELMPHIRERMLANDIFLMFMLKAMFGYCEEQHKLGKQLENEKPQSVNIYLPENNRDTIRIE